MADVKGALTRKIGPLPAWGWGVAIGGSVILFRIVTGKGAFPASGGTGGAGGAGGAGASGQAIGPIIPASETSALAQLSSSDLATLRDYLSPASTPTAAPALAGVGSALAPPDSGPGAMGSLAANVYTAAGGDSLDAIAARYNIPGGGDALYALNSNNVSGRYDVHAGQGIVLWM